MGKWPEKAVSESSYELAQLSCLVQVERAACVTFPLCAVKVTHGSGAVFKRCVSGAVLRSRGSKCLAAMQAAARQVKGAESVSRYRLAGVIPAQCRVSQQAGAVKGRIVSKPEPPSRYSATRCLQRSAPVKGNHLINQALLSGHEALGAVNDSIGQGGDYASAAGAERKNCFYLRKDFLITHSYKK